MLDKEEVFNNMTSNEYKILKIKINRVEDSIREMRQDIKDIKMTLDKVAKASGYKLTTPILSKMVQDIKNIKMELDKADNRYKSTTDILSDSLRSEIEELQSLPHDEAQEIATKNLQECGLIDDDGNMKITIIKSSEEVKEDEIGLKKAIRKAKVCPECGHKNRCPYTYTEKPDMDSFVKVNSTMTNTKSIYTMKNKCDKCGCVYEVKSDPLSPNLKLEDPDHDPETEWSPLTLDPFAFDDDTLAKKQS